MPYSDPEKQRAAQRRYYDDNKSVYRAAKRSKTNVLRRYTTKIKESIPCADCGMTYPAYVMDFDHVRGTKSFSIATSLVNINLDQLKLEIEKCDVVCANCHRHRTWMRKIKLAEG